MALITCPECGNAVSDKATSCIHCGFPISSYIDYEPQPEIEDNFTPYPTRRTTPTPRGATRNQNIRSNTKVRRRTQKKFPYFKVTLIWILIIGIAIGIISKDRDSISEKTAVSIAEEILESYLTWGSSIFNLSFSDAEVETDGYNHYIVSMQYHYENSKGEKRNKFATVFFTYFPETKSYESNILCIKISDYSSGGAKNTFKKDQYYGWGYKEGANITTSPSSKTDEPFNTQGAKTQEYLNEVTPPPTQNINDFSNGAGEYEYLVEVTGLVQPSDYVIDGWELALSKPVPVKDWDGKGQEYSVECSVLYFYPNDTIGGNSPSLFSGKTITVSGTPENYRNGGKYFLSSPALVKLHEDISHAITKENFESMVDLSPRDNHSKRLFEIYYSEQAENNGWEYIGTSYSSFSLPEYDFYSFDIYKMNSEYYLIPFNDYTISPTIYQFIKDKELKLVWSYAV